MEEKKYSSLITFGGLPVYSPYDYRARAGLAAKGPERRPYNKGSINHLKISFTG
jgi:hypothetical protein